MGGTGLAAKTITTGFFSKLTSPFLAKGVLVGGGGVAGLMAGPVGMTFQTRTRQKNLIPRKGRDL